MLFISIFSLFMGCSDAEKTEKTDQKTTGQAKKHDPQAGAHNSNHTPQKAHNNSTKNKKEDHSATHGNDSQKTIMDVGPIPENAKVWFIEPANGAVVASPVKIKMGVEGMTIDPATNGIHNGKGHHHVIVNVPPQKKGMVIPMDENHNHFGKGQTETELTLPPGEHTLHLQFANGGHISYGKQLSATVKITVQ